MLKKYYQYVTKDKYEFPLTRPMLVKEMAEYSGINPKTLSFYGTPTYENQRANPKIRKTGHQRKYKIIAFWCDFDRDDAEDEL